MSPEMTAIISGQVAFAVIGDFLFDLAVQVLHFAYERCCGFYKFFRGVLIRLHSEKRLPGQENDIDPVSCNLE